MVSFRQRRSRVHRVLLLPLHGHLHHFLDAARMAQRVRFGAWESGELQEFSQGESDSQHIHAYCTKMAAPQLVILRCPATGILKERRTQYGAITFRNPLACPVVVHGLLGNQDLILEVPRKHRVDLGRI